MLAFLNSNAIFFVSVGALMLIGAVFSMAVRQFLDAWAFLLFTTACVVWSIDLGASNDEAVVVGCVPVTASLVLFAFNFRNDGFPRMARAVWVLAGLSALSTLWQAYWVISS